MWSGTREKRRSAEQGKYITVDWVEEEGKGKIRGYEKGREENIAILLNHKRALSPGIWKMSKHPRAGWEVLVK